MKLIKRSLNDGERILCKSAGRVVYSGIVKSITKDKKSATLTLDKEIKLPGGVKTTTWKIKKNWSGSWDGMFERQYTGGYWGAYGTWTGKIKNIFTGGTFIYSDVVDNWEKEFMDM